MIMQLNLFGDDPVEAPTAPINQVVSSPKNYRLIPPTNIILDKVVQQVEINIEKKTTENNKKPKVPKVKKEKAASNKTQDNSAITLESVKKKEPKIRTIIALDLFSETIQEPNQIEITEATPEVILSVLPQESKKNIPDGVRRETKEVFPGFIQLEIPDVFAEEIQEETQHIIEELPPQEIIETTPIVEPVTAIVPKQVKPKYVLRVPNVIEIASEPIQEINKPTVAEVPSQIKEEVVNIVVHETSESEDEGIAPSIAAEEDLPIKTSRGRQSIGNYQPDILLINIPDDEILFSKQYYPISEVATMFNVKVSLLRFWENEFDILKPRKNRKGDRLFRPDDIKSLKLIYFLLREKKYTIEGAKMFIKKGKKVKEKFAAIESLKKIKGMLMELKAGLSF